MKLIHKSCTCGRYHYVWRKGESSVVYVGELLPAVFVPLVQRWARSSCDGTVRDTFLFTTRKLLA